jgi:copper chaperone CopZ
MKRKKTTVMLDDMACAAGSAHSIESVLARVPGVLRAYVNPVTEMAYIEFDADRCTETDIVRAAESLGIRAVPTTLH